MPYIYNVSCSKGCVKFNLKESGHFMSLCVWPQLDQFTAATNKIKVTIEDSVKGIIFKIIHECAPVEQGRLIGYT